MVRVEESDWSEKFSLDAAGSFGLVTCKSKDGPCYQLGVTVQLGNEGLTKQVIFTPYHILSNLAEYDIEVCQVLEVGISSLIGRRKWILVAAGQSVPFWPRGKKNCWYSEWHTHKKKRFLFLGTTRKKLCWDWIIASAVLMLTFKCLSHRLFSYATRTNMVKLHFYSSTRPIRLSRSMNRTTEHC